MTVFEASSKLTVTEGTSSSVMETTVSSGDPSVTPVGRLEPKPSLTDSPSSSHRVLRGLEVKDFLRIAAG